MALVYAVWVVGEDGESTLLAKFADEETALEFAAGCADRDRENRYEGAEYPVYVGSQRTYCARHESGWVLCG